MSSSLPHAAHLPARADVGAPLGQVRAPLDLPRRTRRRIRTIRRFYEDGCK
jgi:hypothetical protein